MSPEPLLMTGDFNIHIVVHSDIKRTRLLGQVESIGLQQHFDKLTQVSCHILDLEITRDVNELISTTPTVDYHFSGHFTLICDLRNHRLLSRRQPSGKSGVLTQSHSRIMCSALSRDSTDCLKDLGTLYNRTLSKILDPHALLVTKTFIERPLVPWQNDGGQVRGNPATSW